MKTLDSHQFRLPSDYPVPREIMVKHFPEPMHDLPIAGGWGYGFEDAVIIDSNDPAAKNQPGFDPVKFEYYFAPRRMYEELLFSRPPEDCYSGIEWKLKRQALKIRNGRMYDELVFHVTMFAKKDLETLKEDWESHNGYKGDLSGLKKHLMLRESLRFEMEETFYFDITLTNEVLFDPGQIGENGEEPED